MNTCASTVDAKCIALRWGSAGATNKPWVDKGNATARTVRQAQQSSKHKCDARQCTRNTAHHFYGSVLVEVKYLEGVADVNLALFFVGSPVVTAGRNALGMLLAVQVGDDDSNAQSAQIQDETLHPRQRHRVAVRTGGVQMQGVST